MHKILKYKSFLLPHLTQLTSVMRGKKKKKEGNPRRKLN